MLLYAIHLGICFPSTHCWFLSILEVFSILGLINIIVRINIICYHLSTINFFLFRSILLLIYVLLIFLLNLIVVFDQSIVIYLRHIGIVKTLSHFLFDFWHINWKFHLIVGLIHATHSNWSLCVFLSYFLWLLFFVKSSVF